jgi:hypothetical protein
MNTKTKLITMILRAAYRGQRVFRGLAAVLWAEP